MSSHRTRFAAVMQRLPVITHVTMAAFSFVGPTHLPYLFAAVILAIHCALWSVNMRTIYGAYRAWRGVKQHALTDWRTRFVFTPKRSDALLYDHVEHIIIIPNYKEDVSVLRETLYLLSTHPLALTSYHPVLAMEARENGSASKANGLIQEFKGKFRDIGTTRHPGGIAGEAAGKSSNLSWAIRQAWAELKEAGDEDRIKRTVVTVIDSDTALAGDYFSSVSCKFALGAASERSRMFFVPPICFDRNASDVPAAIRITDIMWALAGLSSIYPSSGAKIPTSAYSLSMTLAASVGFHDAGPQAIGEDMHMFIKCLFATRGQLITETVYSPASQLDVVAEQRNGIRGYFNDHVARYNQALRHMWGSLDTGYGMTRLLTRNFSSPAWEDVVKMPREPSASVFTPSTEGDAAMGLTTIPEELPIISRSQTPSTRSLDEFSDGCTTPDSEADTPLSQSTAATSYCESWDEKAPLVSEEPLAPIRVIPFVSLVARLYEAHMLMGNMTVLVLSRVLLGGPSQSETSFILFPSISLATLKSSSAFLEWAYNLTDRMRALSLLFSVIMFIFYDLYHQQTVKHRWAIPGNRLGVQASERSERPWPRAMLDYLALPAGVIFGALPLLHAQVMHIFTDKLTYTVSLKVVPSLNKDAEKAIPV